MLSSVWLEDILCWLITRMAQTQKWCPIKKGVLVCVWTIQNNISTWLIASAPVSVILPAVLGLFLKWPVGGTAGRDSQHCLDIPILKKYHWNAKYGLKHMHFRHNDACWEIINLSFWGTLLAKEGIFPLDCGYIFTACHKAVKSWAPVTLMLLGRHRRKVLAVLHWGTGTVCSEVSEYSYLPCWLGCFIEFRQMNLKPAAMLS